MLCSSELCQATLKKKLVLQTEALEEIEEYLAKNAWLNDIYSHCKQWNDDAVQQWKGKAAFSIEVCSVYLLLWKII